jgi:acetylornithine deacetylase/succinyl-diaminopimelate desuccinylase-like protein
VGGGLLGLALAALLPASPAGAVWPFGRDPGPDPVADLGASAADLLARAIRIDTTNPPGDERPLAELFVDVLRRNGVEAKLVETPSAGSEVGRAAAWGRVPGRGNARPLILLSHLDAVPSEPAEWAVEPLAGVVGGGYVVGRGALDAKGVGVVHLMTLLELARRETPLERDVIFLATPDEETGGRDGAGWVTSSRKDLLRDAEYLLTEGGSILVGNGTAAPVWGVAVAEKSPCWLRVSVRGTPGHSSAPSADAAVPRLVAALERVRTMENDVHVTPEVERMFRELAPYVAPDDAVHYRHLALSLDTDPLFRSRFLSNRGRAALVRNTVTITVLEGSPRTNILPAEAFAHLDARILPGQRCKVFANRIRTVIADPGVEIEPILSFASRSSPADTPLFQAIQGVAGEIDPEAAVLPRVIAGFTDAHYFRDLGIVAYGFVPRWLPASETRGIHGPNERVSIQNLERGVRALVRILERLDAQ